MERAEGKRRWGKKNKKKEKKEPCTGNALYLDPNSTIMSIKATKQSEDKENHVHLIYIFNLWKKK
jgi:hypothetical protein